MKIAWLRAFSMISRNCSRLSRSAASAPRPSEAESDICARWPVRMIEVEIIGPEQAGLHQPRQVRDGKAPALQRDQPFRAQGLHHPVDVDGGQPAGVGDV